MNNNRIASLMVPVYKHEAANELYVDRKARKILQGYIPNLRSISTTRAPSDKFGFVVTATSYLGNHYKPINAFNGTYSSGTGAGGEWVSNSETRNFWIQRKCPDVVRLWRIALRGIDLNTHRIYYWRLKGSTDGESFTTLFEPPNPTYLGNKVRNFPITMRHKFNIFRLFCIEAEPTNPSYMQLYVYFD